MNDTFRIGIVALLAGVGACAVSSGPLRDIPLEWKPTSEVGSSSVQATAQTISFETFKDVRQNPQLIAENREKATPRPVTTQDDVGAFVTTHVRELLQRGGLNTVDTGGNLVVSGEVRQFFVEETDTYKGTVILHVTVRDRDGKTLWDGNASGQASTFGRSYSAENYYEVLSDSVIDATTTLLKDPDFRRALAPA